MKKTLIRIGVLALALAAVVLLHKQVQKEAAEAEAAAHPEIEEEEEPMQSLSVISIDNGVTLGRMEENPDGGVTVTVKKEDGEEASYWFKDVAIDSWYASAVNFVVSAGLMTGPGEDPYFQPEYGVLREAFAAILYRYASGQPVKPRYQFADVEQDKWYIDVINWVTNERLMTGLVSDEGTIFGIGQYMTCEQALVGLYRLAGTPETDGSLTDYPYASKVSESGRNAVDWAWDNGLITEVECVWYPTQAISRAQVALLLMRYSDMSG